MSKIIYLPLDERPCNYRYPELIQEISGESLLRPPRSILGYKKEPADISAVKDWLLANLAGVKYLVISIDMLVYGGILASRIHHLASEKMLARLELLTEIKKIKPELKIFAFNLITRVPAYNSSDEEPDYYEEYGARIFKYGFLSDKITQGLADVSEKEEFAQLKSEPPETVMSDYLTRRRKNHLLNKEAIKLVEKEVIDFLVLPMDDNAEYGFSAEERSRLLKIVKKKKLSDKIYSYPGADEVGSILTSRAFLAEQDFKPRVYLRYSSEKGKNLVPYLEDRSLDLTVKYQVITGGGVVVDNSLEADYILMVNAPSELTLKQMKSWDSILNRETIIDPQRNLAEFVEAINYYLANDRDVALADVALLNGSDPDLMELLKAKQILGQLSAYAGWNTSSNTLGTVIAQANMVAFLKAEERYSAQTAARSRRFLGLRYLEDWGYQYYIRAEVTKMLADYELNYFDLKDKEREIAELVKAKLRQFQADNLSEIDYDFTVAMPWNRMFEVDIKLS